MWRLLFEGQIVQGGLNEYMIHEYMFYDGVHEDENIWVDISEFAETKVVEGQNTSVSLDRAGTTMSRTSPRPS